MYPLRAAYASTWVESGYPGCIEKVATAPASFVPLVSGSSESATPFAYSTYDMLTLGAEASTSGVFVTPTVCTALATVHARDTSRVPMPLSGNPPSGASELPSWYV